jgi:hypothetical protein
MGIQCIPPIFSTTMHLPKPSYLHSNCHHSCLFWLFCKRRILRSG